MRHAPLSGPAVAAIVVFPCGGGHRLSDQSLHLVPYTFNNALRRRAPTPTPPSTPRLSPVVPPWRLAVVRRASRACGSVCVRVCAYGRVDGSGRSCIGGWRDGSPAAVWLWHGGGAPSAAAAALLSGSPPPLPRSQQNGAGRAGCRCRRTFVGDEEGDCCGRKPARGGEEGGGSPSVWPWVPSAGRPSAGGRG